ncbi:MAG: MerC domain-containing protein [Pseudomonadota bacterium]
MQTPEQNSQAAQPGMDGAAMGIASLCLMHCLLLPSIAAALPIFATAAEAEWLHKLLVLAAFPPSLFTIFKRWGKPGGAVFTAASLVGLALLTAAISSEAMEAFETPLTIAGGVTLFLAHGAWWVLHRNRAAR